MNKKQKPLKPGQLFTINNHIYRVTKEPRQLCSWCDKCEMKFCELKVRNLCFWRVPLGCYFKLVK